MFKIPEEFRDIPEAIRLREAEVQFEAAIEQEKRATQQSGERVHLIGRKLRHAQEELQKAQDAFDAATGEPKPVGLTPAVVEEISLLFSPPERRHVEEVLDQSCGRTLPFQREATAQELEHIRICVLRLSSSDLKKLHEWIDLANVDERDVILAAQADNKA